MSGFTSSQTGKFEDYFMTTTDLIDDYAQGGMWLCGYNSSGQLGTNNTVHRSSPVQTVAGSSNWNMVSCGAGHVAAIKTDGTLWIWGNNSNGELGINILLNKSSPVQTVTGGTNWKMVSCSRVYSAGFTAAIKTDGTLWMCGYNFSGQLGTNNTVHRSSPVQTILGGTNWKTVSAGYSHTAAIKTDGTLWLWGNGQSGQLGNNNITDRSSPVQTITIGTNWKSVSAGYSYTAAIKTDGTLWTWGANLYGELGTNDRISRSSPVQTIAGGTNWKSASSGHGLLAAIKTDGTLWVCGYNYYGELGVNDRIHRSSPVQTIAGGTNWKFVSASSYTVSAIKTDGTLWNWGRNYWGKLGVNDTTHRSSPVQTVAGGTNWKIVSGGLDAMAATQYSDISQIL